MDADFFKRIEKKEASIEGPEFVIQKRHWGFSVVLDANTRIHSICDEPSAHFHRYRTEDYILYSGEMTVYRGENFDEDPERTIGGLKPAILAPGDKIVLPPGIVHVPINTGKENAVFLEISHGPYEEADIKRVYDKNGRDAELAATWRALGYKAGVGIKDLISLIHK